MKISDRLRPDELPAHISEEIHNLTELTGGHTSGILIYEEQVIVCDWSETKGLPFVTFAYDFVFTGSDDVTLSGVRRVDDVRTVLPGIVEYDREHQTLRGKGMEIFSDSIGDIPAFFGYQAKGGRPPEFSDDGNVIPVPAVCYSLSGGGETVLVVVPESWT